MIINLLSLLRRHGSALMATGLVIGLAFPGLAAILRPALPTFIFLLVVSAFLTVDWPALLTHARRPLRLVLISIWNAVAIPIALVFPAQLLHLPPQLIESIALWATSPPLSSSVAMAVLLGLDDALALLVMAIGTFISPFILPPLTVGLIGVDLGLGVIPLMTRLTLFIGGAGLVAFVLRHFIGNTRLQRYSLHIGGFNVVLLNLFAIAIMDGVRDRIFSEPETILLFVTTAFAISLLAQTATFIAFFWLGWLPALTSAMLAGNRNMGVVVATLGSAASPEIVLFFVAVQFPIYLLPMMLGPIYRRFGAGIGNQKNT
ncbi:MAG TPA: hypothetical protein VHN11_07595 [Xanthobacteraceae bacterium]|jgi:BASS family bile acid:Na+ symporter|nr:hypothetical protein [Xanthobacteraceae bacterium]